ncbi:MAG TPA: hypothetical protein VNG12_15060, partial [Acidimicrobiales bacterium]|nr:hypothetical protein [Acidimicrobiales bacterium]
LDRELPALELRALGVDCDLLVDCGRLVSSAPGQHSVLGRADVVVLVTRPDASAVTHARWAIDRITALGHNDYRQIALLTVGEGPFDADELAGVLKVELLGSVPHDPASAAILRGEPGSARVFGRSSLVTRAQHLLGRLPLPNPDEVWRHAS